MKAVVLAYSEMGCVGLEALIRNGYEVSAVFTHQDNPNENQWFRSVAEIASMHNIPVYAPQNINHPLWQQRITAMAPDFIFSFYYRDMVKQPILDIPKRGALNLHGSLLPKYRGKAPINWVIANGETETGVTLHYMVSAPDAGDIVDQVAVAISEQDTAKTLYDKMALEAAKLLDRTLPKLTDGSAARTPQDHSKATYFGGRKPADGKINWDSSPKSIRNLIRAVTKPYPGAFSFVADKKVFIWKAKEVDTPHFQAPGSVLSTNPLQIVCKGGTLEIESGQVDGGVFLNGAQLARDLALAAGSRFAEPRAVIAQRTRKQKVLILGVDGFIGNSLSERLLESGKYEVHGMDLQCGKIGRLLNNPDFHFREGDISIHREWIEHHIKKCDIILPLVAIATPAEYVRNPLRVFNLDFEENLRVVRYCVKYGKRLIFPSTSEVYGMCQDPEFDEDKSSLVMGPIRMQRWIYACSKQLLDRVIWAYGIHEKLRFSLFRPFNWIGPRLDSLDSARIGSSRAITQLILNLVEGTPMALVDGGLQKRCFTDISDGIECLFQIIENARGNCDGQIFNVGNPDNEYSVKEQAELLYKHFERHPLRSHFPAFAGFKELESAVFYGDGFQDMQHRRPSIKNAKKLLGWEPKVPFEESVARTLDFFLREAVESTTKQSGPSEHKIAANLG